MRLTVSSTAMMKPLLKAPQHQADGSPPSRLAGLLEFTRTKMHEGDFPHKLVQYIRPDQQHALLQTARWHDFFQLDSAKKIPCAAVFGFEFDGTSTWYQVWNRKTGRYCWLLHTSDMNYESFATVVMDALVSLLPNWNGTLYPSPDLSAERHGSACLASRTIDARDIHNVLISDASTSPAGHLWFLVTINSTRLDQENGAVAINSQSGWISPTN